MYEIDANNNRTATETYAYDELSRLTNVTYPSAGSGQASPTQAYTFDKVGNRLTLNDNGTVKTYSYNAVNELMSGSEGSWTYDLNGNTITDPQRTYQWDVQNRLISVTKGTTTVNFTYRSDALRASKQVVGGITIDYIYDGQTVIGEIVKDVNGNVTKKVWYTPGPNGYISRTETNASDVVTNKEWFVYDGLGSCRAMVKPVNNNGTWDAVITARFDYDVYGKVRTSSGSTENKFKYVGGSCGHPTDDETGLIYMRARYYDPGTGRFVNEDPARNGENWYLYANAQPISRVDDTGEAADFIEAGQIALWWAGAKHFWDAVMMSPYARGIAQKYMMSMVASILENQRSMMHRLTVSYMQAALEESWVFGSKGQESVAERAIAVTMVYAARIEFELALMGGPTWGGF